MPYSNITITTNSSLSFRQYDFIQVTHDADNYIIGRVVSYNSANGQLTFTPLVVKGSGSFSTWEVTLTGDPGDDGTSGSSGTAGQNSTSGTSGSSLFVNNEGPNRIIIFNNDGTVLRGASNLTFDGHTLVIDPFSYSVGGDPVYRVVYHNDGTAGTAGIVIRASIPGQPYSGIVENRVPHDYQHQFVVGSNNIAHIDAQGLHIQQALIADNGVYFESLELDPSQTRFLVWDPSTSGGLQGKVKWRTSGAEGAQGPAGPAGVSGTSGSSGTSGETGASGSSGSSGETGTSGTSGTSGTTGTSGSSGTSGTSDNYVGSSADTVDLSALSVGQPVAITTTTGLSYTVAQLVTVGYSHYELFSGQVISYNPSTGLLVLEITDIEGTGTYSSWTTNLGGAAGGDGTSGTSGISGTSGTSGTSGSSGEAGPAGSSGTSGEAGPAGSSGTSGGTGTSGTSGQTGSSGESGSSGTSGTSGEGFNWVGGWMESGGLSTTPYGLNDVVYYNGRSYVSVASNIPIGSVAPDISSDWDIMASDGASGTAGTSGSSNGSSGTSGNTGAAGSSGTSGNSGSSGTSGNTGAAGSSGTSGNSGSSGTSGNTGAAGSSGTSGSSFVSPYTGNLQITGQAWITSYTASASSTINWNNGNVQFYTLSTSTTFTFTNGNAGSTYILVVKQASAGGYTINWPGTVTWTSTPTMTSTGDRYDIYTFVYVDNKYFGSYLQNFA